MLILCFFGLVLFLVLRRGSTQVERLVSLGLLAYVLSRGRRGGGFWKGVGAVIAILFVIGYLVSLVPSGPIPTADAAGWTRHFERLCDTLPNQGCWVDAGSQRVTLRDDSGSTTLQQLCDRADPPRGWDVVIRTGGQEARCRRGA